MIPELVKYPERGSETPSPNALAQPLGQDWAKAAIGNPKIATKTASLATISSLVLMPLQQGCCADARGKLGDLQTRVTRESPFPPPPAPPRASPRASSDARGSCR